MRGDGPAARAGLIVILGAACLIGGRVARAGDASNSPSVAVAAAAAEAIPSSALAAFECLTADDRRPLTAAYIDEAEKLFGDAAKAEPKEGKWILGQGMIARSRGERVKARELCKKAAGMMPDSAAAHAWLGTTTFESINEAGFFEKMGLADQGFDAYQKALRLDPGRLDARIGLFQFYLNAPGIAGGSVKKAKEQANAMLALAGAGPYMGHVCLAQAAAEDEDWPALAAACENAAKAARDPREARGALALHGNLLLTKKEDPAAAIPVLEKAAEGITAKEDTSPFYLLGQAHMSLKQWEKARGYYAQVVEAKPEAQNSRYALAECCEQCGDLKAAIEHYAEFAARFPKDDRAKKAEAAVKRLKKKVGG